MIKSSVSSVIYVIKSEIKTQGLKVILKTEENLTYWNYKSTNICTHLYLGTHEQGVNIRGKKTMTGCV